MAASHLSREALACAPFAGPTMLALKDPKLRHRLTIALDADKELLPQRLLALLAAVEAEADRAFIAHAGTVSENEMFDFAFHLPRRATLHRKINKWVVKQPPRSSCRRI